MVRTLGKSQHNDQDAILRQMLTVSENDIPNVSHSQSVYQDRSGLHMTGYSCTLVIKFQHISCLKNENIFFRNSKLLRNARVCFHMAVLSVYRNRIFRLHEGINQL